MSRYYLALAADGDTPPEQFETLVPITYEMVLRSVGFKPEELLFLPQKTQHLAFDLYGYGLAPDEAVAEAIRDTAHLYN